MNLHIAVVGHATRQERAERLAESLGAELFIDHLTLGATWNHLRALNWGATKPGHLIALEDDAEPVTGFADLAAQWIEHHPEELTSFYLGTGHLPSKPETVTAALVGADASGSDHVTFPRLYTAVAYAIPTHTIPTLRLNTRGVADTGLGQRWVAKTGRPIYYTVPSYVEHADVTSVENPRRTHPQRKAYRLHAGL
jgi:hypothetical protein